MHAAAAARNTEATYPSQAEYASRPMPAGRAVVAADPVRGGALPRPRVLPAGQSPPTRHNKTTARTPATRRPIVTAVRPAPMPGRDAPAWGGQPSHTAAADVAAPDATAPDPDTRRAELSPAMTPATGPGSSAGSAAADPGGATASTSNPVPATAATVAGPSPRAVEILVQANQLAGRADAEADFTRVAQQCRHVMAIDSTPAATDYSRRLAGWALNKRGELRADAGRNAEAMADFDDALAMDPDCWRATHNRGVLLAQAGAFAEAFDAFNETVARKPSFAKGYSNRAALFVQAGDFQASMNDYARAIETDPDLAIAHKGRGRVCHMVGHMEQALRHLDAAALLAPEDASVASCRADLLVDMGRYAAAVEAYQRAISIDPGLVSAYRNLAWLQATCPNGRHKDASAALANARRALELSDAEDDISLDTLAAAQAATGDYRSAAATIRRAIQLAPAGDQPVYAERLSLYESGKPFTSEPAAVQTTGYEGLVD